jgi:hypothetical protein
LITMPMNIGTTISPPGTLLIVCRILISSPFVLFFRRDSHRPARECDPRDGISAI